ncbi:hypothetical protein SAMN02745857_04041 [Andreprevotia lacus DSM 23236]|jgi:hypothetical protein|uniref:Uncharacterized protein n=1 Tax=Andreprevotia lacus DSM 23236 TaxID=1121001 RepID=A0A1W1Y0P2_9NEIS|nr:Ig-like domain-containing protein [Andreprevotia lacus]SMC29707.1 hypothetical protein SAMN02745857_04041 [Andreprevotia lacus DSM 23236]
MRTLFNGDYARNVCAVAATTAAALIVAGCNGGAGGGGLGTGGTPTSVPTTTPTGAAKVTFDASTVSLVLGDQKQITATILDASGKPVSGAVVRFGTDATLGIVAPNARITGADGKATVTLSVASPSASGNVGALNVTATYTDSSNVNQTVSGTIAYSVGDSTLVVNSLTVGSSTLDPYATTAVNATVTVNGTASSGRTVNFTSICAATGKAQLTASALTDANGLASVSYTDKGCGNNDTITASLAGTSSSKQVAIKVNPPVASSLQYSSVIPADGIITLLGYGTAARPDSATVKFKLVDATGSPIPNQSVQMTLEIGAGGVSLKDSVNGLVNTVTNAAGEAAVTVIAGKQPTPVRVKATYTNGGTTLTSQSAGLSISTGFPDQDSLSLSANRYNINGWGYDGATATITVRVADHFNNPVPDGTAFNFITDSGRIGNGTQGSCVTTNSACSITLSSQNPRVTSPHNLVGRVHIVAYAIGEESFVDKNNSIDFDAANEQVDISGVSSDIGEAFLDHNENGVFDLGVDQLVDFNNDGIYNGPDGKYNGSLCKPGYAGCSAQKTLHVFSQATFIFSSDIPKTPVLSAPIVLNCATQSSQSVTLYIPDINGNILPVGTTIASSISSGGASITFGDGNTVIGGTPDVDAKVPLMTLFSLTLKAPATGCTAGTTGTFNVTVTAPDHGGGTGATTKFQLPYSYN